MWDLSVPGGNDHDFYIDTTAAAILVHNCDDPAQYERTGSGLKDDIGHRAASWVVGDPDAVPSTVVGGDGVTRTLYQLPGELSGKPGIFEWMIDESGDDPVITHQRFITGGTITGSPNQ
jgi:hypothetical protein